MLEWILSSCVLILAVVGLRYLLRGRLSLRLQYAMCSSFCCGCCCR